MRSIETGLLAELDGAAPRTERIERRYQMVWSLGRAENHSALAARSADIDN
jgi:hypothetical protein